MADQIGSVYYTIGARDKELLDSLKKSRGAVDGLDKNFKKSSASIVKGFKVIGLSAVAAFGAIAYGATQAVKAASDLNEQTSKFGVTFSEVMGDATAASDELVNSYGLSTRESQQFLSTTGDLVKGLGFTQDVTLELSSSLNKLAVDVTSFKNVQGGVEQTTRAFNSAILGEREALKSLGFSISEAEVKQVLFEKGQNRLTGASLRQAKALATIELITKKNADAVGDFGRTSDQVANVFRRVSSRAEDLRARLGKDLLPDVGKLGEAFLSASGKGGFLEAGLTGITNVAKGAIQILTNLINILNRSFDKDLQKRIASGEERLTATTGAIQKNITAYEKHLEVMKARGDSAEKLEKQEKAIAVLYRELESADEDLAATRRKSAAELDKLAEATKKEAEESGKSKEEKARLLAIQNATIAASKEELKAREKAQSEAQKIISEFGLTEVALVRKAGADKNAAINESLQKGRITQEQANDLKIINEIQTQDKITDIQKQAEQERLQKALTVAGAIITGVSGLMSALSQLVSVNLQSAVSGIDAQLALTLEAIDAQTQAQLEAAGLVEETTAEKAETEIATLEDKLARTRSIAEKERIKELLSEKKAEQKRLKILADAEAAKLEAEKQAEIERKKAARAAAEDQKAFSIANILLSTPLAAMRAYASMSSFSPIAASIAAGLALAAGAVQLEAVRRTELPALAEGGIVSPVSGGQDVTVAEAGTPELVAPLTDEVFNRLGAAIGETIGGQQTIMLTVNVGNQVLYAEVNTGIEDGEIIIQESDLAAG